MIRALKELIAGSRLKKTVDASMGLKFVVAMTGFVSLLMVAGTFFVAHLLTSAQYRVIETRGRELGMFLGKAGSDYIVEQNIVALDALVAEAAKSEDVLYAVVRNADGVVISNPYVSFNRENPEVKKLLTGNATETVPALMEKVRKRFDVRDIEVAVKPRGVKLGTVTIGFQTAGVKKDIRNLVCLLLGTSVAIVFLLAILLFIMSRRMIVKPTMEAVAIASNIAAGDLSKSVHVKSVDEIGMLGRGLNRMIIGLKGMIGNVRAASRNLETVSGEVTGISGKIATGSHVQAESVEEAASSVNEMHFALKEIAGNVEDLYVTSEQTSSSVIETSASVGEVARTMSDLSQSIEETSSAIVQLSASVRRIADNISTLSKEAEETAASANEISASVREVEAGATQSAALAEAVSADAQQLGVRSIGKTIEGMIRITESTSRTAEVVNRLGERADSIGSILTVIEDITDQTGLLALNAAILAAQAGEHGKGFAVVAAEIRELANRTAASTQEISKLISAVQDDTRGTVEAMREGAVIVEEGMRLATATGEALQTILERADQARDMSRGINRAATEQARGIKQVSAAIDRINDMAHQISRAVNEQRTGSEQIARAAEKMRTITQFVKSSTEEQAKASRDITGAVEKMSAKIGLVNRATTEVRSGSDLIVQAIGRIKDIARENAQLAAGLNSAVDTLANQAGSLKKEIEKFKT